MNRVLTLNDVVVNIGNFTLRAPELRLAPGRLFHLSGPSGSGKSTLLNAIGGFTPLSGGTIAVDGRLISELRPERRRIAYVFQRPGLFPHLDVMGNIEFGMKLQKLPVAKIRARAVHLLEELEIERLADRKISEISGGQAQRVALARALAVEFPVLLLDEPFGALEERLRQKCRAFVEKFLREKGIYGLAVSHEAETCDDDSLVVKIESGHVSRLVSAETY